MKILSTSLFASTLAAASWVLLPAFDASGQTSVATNPVGYLQTSCLSNSDTLVAPPFTRAAAFTGAVSSISGGTITFNASSLTADAYDAPATTPATKDTYYLRIGPVTATLAGTLAVTQGSTAVTGTGTTFGTDVKIGDRLTINDGYNLLTYTVAAIASTTSLTLDRAFSDSAAGGTTSSVTTGKTTTVKTTTLKPTSTKLAATSATGTLSGLSATFDHSPYEGRFYQVVSNSVSSANVNLNGDTLSSVAIGTQVSIIPYWTLNSIFPAANANVSFTPTTSLFTLKTQILIPDYASSGTNLSAAAVYLYYNDGASNVGWRAVGDLNTDHGYDPLTPDGYVTVRTPASAPALPVTFSGTVPMTRLVTTLTTRTAGAQDNPVALNRPADQTLGSLGLGPKDGSFVATTSLFSLQDELFVYDNTKTGFNKSSAGVYIYFNDGASNVGWRAVGDLSTDHGSDVIAASSALTVRKASTAAGQTAIWNNSPNY